MNKKEMEKKLKKLFMEQDIKGKSIIDENFYQKTTFSTSKFLKREDADTEISKKEAIEIISEKDTVLESIFKDLEDIHHMDIRWTSHAFMPYLPKECIEVNVEIKFYVSY